MRSSYDAAHDHTGPAVSSKPMSENACAFERRRDFSAIKAFEAVDVEKRRRAAMTGEHCNACHDLRFDKEPWMPRRQVLDVTAQRTHDHPEYKLMFGFAGTKKD